MWVLFLSLRTPGGGLGGPLLCISLRSRATRSFRGGGGGYTGGVGVLMSGQGGGGGGGKPVHTLHPRIRGETT